MRDFVHSQLNFREFIIIGAKKRVWLPARCLLKVATHSLIAEFFRAGMMEDVMTSAFPGYRMLRFLRIISFRYRCQAWSWFFVSQKICRRGDEVPPDCDKQALSGWQSGTPRSTSPIRKPLPASCRSSACHRLRWRLIPLTANNFPKRIPARVSPRGPPFLPPGAAKHGAE